VTASYDPPHGNYVLGEAQDFVSNRQMGQQAVFTSDGILAWRFLRVRADRLLPRGPLPHGGDWVAVSGQASNRLGATLPGLHAHVAFRRAIEEGTGMTACRILLAGTIREGRHGWLVGTQQTILWIAPAGAVVRQFAVDLAERSLLAERASGREPDPRLWHTLAVARVWRKGEASIKEWLAAKAGAVAAHAEAIERTWEANDRGNLLARLALHASEVHVRDEEWAMARIQYAEREATVARHVAASTLLNVDAALPKALWRITRHAANAMAITREANRPPEARQVGDINAVAHTWGEERRHFNRYWDGLYDELERLLTDASAPV
jgi:hypothetical protein